ncbi:MAG TPA: hypothetical protein VFO77_06690 [Actinoplanes sp.]|nr:hypothetical protein [Actinoplanes sp.]
MKNNEADLIWNRACSAEEITGVGDQQLRALLRVHAVVKSRGVDRAIAALTDDDFTAAVAACGYFDLSGLAAVIASMPLTRGDEATVTRLEAQYKALVPQDQALFDAFAERLGAAPQDFAPVDPATLNG